MQKLITKLGPTQIPTSRGVDKQSMVCPWKGHQFSNKERSVICNVVIQSYVTLLNLR